MFCVKCRVFEKVVWCQPEYKWVCRTCLKYGSKYGARVQVEQRAIAHYRKHRDHRVDVTDQDGDVTWQSRPDLEPPLPLVLKDPRGCAIPPF